jgi:hypothetical protein
MYCNTCENTVNIFTKPLGKIKFELLREMLGVEVNTVSIEDLEIMEQKLVT